jgi:hypothetical protein
MPNQNSSIPTRIVKCAVWTDAQGHAQVALGFDKAVDVTTVVGAIFVHPEEKLVAITDWKEARFPGMPTMLVYEDATGEVVLPQTGSVVYLSVRSRRAPRWVLSAPVEVGLPTTYDRGVATSIDALGDKLGVTQRRFDKDFLAYPLLTSGGGATSYANGAGPASDVLGAAVDEEIRTLLGRIPADDDVTSIASSLEASFTVQVDDGIETLAWAPPNVAATTKMGAGVTGVQANLVAVAQAVLGNARQAIPGLEPLWNDDLADAQEIQADKDILTVAIDDFLREAGIDGGPSRPKVNLLLRQMQDAVDDLGIRLGMRGAQDFTRMNVVSPEDEHRLTEYIIASKAVGIVAELWAEYEPQDPAQRPPKDLGTRFFLLEQALSRSSEIVDEVYTALGSLYVDRQLCAQTVLKPLGLTIDQVFSWVKSYITYEAFGLVQQAGVRGAALIALTLGNADDDQTMIGVVKQVQALQADTGGDPTIPEGFYHPRAQRPINELVSSLLDAAAAAQAAGSTGVFNAKDSLQKRNAAEVANLNDLLLIEQ